MIEGLSGLLQSRRSVCVFVDLFLRVPFIDYKFWDLASAIALVTRAPILTGKPLNMINCLTSQP